jgi:hypothetical protein
VSRTVRFVPHIPAVAAARESLLASFEGAWRQGQAPSIRDFLSRTTPEESRATLVELVHTDLEYRLRAGQSCRVEEYLRAFPELAGDGDLLRELVVSEYELRQCYQDRPTLEEYADRFPQLTDELPSLLALAASREFALAPGSRFGRFQVLERVGSGSFGIVYKAWDGHLGRTVALKVIRPDRVADPVARERFLREARGAARLSHPGIAPVFEAGQLLGVCYLVGGFVPGRTLAELERLEPRAVASLVARVAEAAHHAHASTAI